jgi:hypothetical protein
MILGEHLDLSGPRLSSPTCTSFQRINSLAAAPSSPLWLSLSKSETPGEPNGESRNIQSHSLNIAHLSGASFQHVDIFRGGKNPDV